VYGQNSAGILKHRLIPVKGFKIEGNESGLPVIAMENVELQIESYANLENAPAEKGETGVVVRIITLRRTVQFRPAEIFFVSNKIDSAFPFWFPSQPLVGKDPAFFYFIPYRDVDFQFQVNQTVV
jgi:hypothetical protein